MFSYLRRKVTNVFPFAYFSMLIVLLEFLMSILPNYIGEQNTSRNDTVSSKKGELKLY